MPRLSLTREARFWKEPTRNPSLVLDRLSDPDPERRKEPLSRDDKETHGDKFLRHFAEERLSFNGYPYPQYQEALQSLGEDVLVMELTLRTPMAVGMGNETVLENGLAFNRIYGTPLIPGSSIKGLLRRTLGAFLGIQSTLSEAEAKDDEAWMGLDEKTWGEKLGIKPEDFTPELKAYFAILGSPDRQGALTVFDAWWKPQDTNPFMKDVITHHHDAYYQEKQDLPLDSDQPTPSAFISVQPGETFLFPFKLDKASHPRLVELVTYALTQVGIGAKTNSGYGFFEAGPDSLATPTTVAAQSAVARSAVSTPEEVEVEIRHFDRRTLKALALLNGQQVQVLNAKGCWKGDRALVYWNGQTATFIRKLASE